MKNEAGRAESRSYGRPRRGRLVMFCEKCQRRMDADPLRHDALDVRGEFQACADGAKEGQVPVRVMEVECMKICPEGGVTVCTDPLRRRPDSVSVVRSAEEVATVYARMVGVRALEVVSEAGLEPATVSLEG